MSDQTDALLRELLEEQKRTRQLLERQLEIMAPPQGELQCRVSLDEPGVTWLRSSHEWWYGGKSSL